MGSLVFCSVSAVSWVPCGANEWAECSSLRRCWRERSARQNISNEHRSRKKRSATTNVCEDRWHVPAMQGNAKAPWPCSKEVIIQIGFVLTNCEDLYMLFCLQSFEWRSGLLRTCHVVEEVPSTLARLRKPFIPQKCVRALRSKLWPESVRDRATSHCFWRYPVWWHSMCHFNIQLHPKFFA